MVINERLIIPDKTQAILWDMDGVLLDSLGLDLVLCNQLLNKYVKNSKKQAGINLPRDFILLIFAWHPPEFWRLIFEFVESEYKIIFPEKVHNQILNEYNMVRNNSIFDVNPGIIEILTESWEKRIKLAVVSNNPFADVERILKQAGIAGYFDIIVGNDLENLEPKPAPDTYLYAAKSLNINLDLCVVIEDSLLGVKAGHTAGCFTIGVATGGHSFESLVESGWPKQVYTSFKPNALLFERGNVTDKYIQTANDFISHMVEHLAWRMGAGINLHWNNNDWTELGKMIGKHVAELPMKKKAGAALGMIDDGSAEVSVKIAQKPELIIKAEGSIDLSWFLSLRCEQSKSGKPMLDLLNGMAEGLCAKIHISICSVEDPHHTWEGIFRSVGIVLGNMLGPIEPENIVKPDKKSEKEYEHKGIWIESVSDTSATVVRKTAESALHISVDFNGYGPGIYKFRGSPAIHVNGFWYVLDLLAQEAGFSINVDFDAVALSSSHVITEDIGLVMGRALKEILIVRMNKFGVQGSGSSVETHQDMALQTVSIGVSVEGRKFVKFVPFKQNYDEFKKNFLIGHNIHGAFSEDMDDFIDGLAGGLAASIMIHIKENIDPAKGWEIIFKNLGKALKGVFQANPCRIGMPPGVKATLS
jgi:HAD superfamily hydrolase (TIGR01509 family)